MLNGIAIVLNKLEKGSGFLLLHQYLGKIKCFFPYQKQHNLCVGSLVSCTLEEKKSYYIFTSVETDFIPLLSEQHDIYFIHNLLKLCLEVPFGVRVDDVFSHVIETYKEMHSFTDQDKNRSLLQLFFFLSIFPESIQLYNMVMNHSISYDDILGKKGLDFCWEKYYQQKLV